MWESRPLPKIVRDPLAALSARGSFFVPAPPGIFCFGDGRQGLEIWRKNSLRGGKPFWKKVLPPRAPPFQKLLPLGLRFASGPVHGWESLPKAGMVSLPERLCPAAWRSVPFAGRKERKGIAGACTGHPGAALPDCWSDFPVCDRDLLASGLRIPCSLLRAARRTDLPCALWEHSR